MNPRTQARAPRSRWWGILLATIVACASAQAIAQPQDGTELHVTARGSGTTNCWRFHVSLLNGRPGAVTRIVAGITTPGVTVASASNIGWSTPAPTWNATAITWRTATSLGLNPSADVEACFLSDSAYRAITIVFTGYDSLGRSDALLRDTIIVDAPRPVDPCATDTLTLNTGWDDASGRTIPVGSLNSAWTVIADPDPTTAEPRPAVVVTPHPLWAGPLANSMWINGYPDINASAAGDYSFQTCFCVQRPTQISHMVLDVLADDGARVFLNGNLVGQTPPTWGFSAPPTHLDLAPYLVGGVNCLVIQVSNYGGPCGLNVGGIVTANNGVLRKPGCCTGLPNPCAADTLRLSTGWDYRTGGTIAVGSLNSDWTITADPDPTTVEPRPAVVVESIAGWAGPLANSTWISGYPSIYSALVGDYSFQTCFCVQRPEQVSHLILDILADNDARVFLNGTLVGQTIATYGFKAPPTHLDLAPYLVGGVNCLVVQVHNQSGPSGLNVSGFITADNGVLRKPGCCTGRPDPCATDTLTLNTGWDYRTGGTIPIGASGSAWTVIADPDPTSTEPRPAVAADPYPGWAGPLANSTWISGYPDVGTSRGGTYTFQTCFCVAQPTQATRMILDVLADNDARVFLNGTLIGQTIATTGFKAPPAHIDLAPYLVGGVNCLVVQVHNQSGPCGLNVRGVVTADDGALRKPACCDSTGWITGRKIDDLNGNGRDDNTIDQRNAEPGLEGWQITLEPGKRTTRTDAAGNFYFGGLPPGDYTIAETAQPGWTQTAPGGRGTHAVKLGAGDVLKRDFLNLRRSNRPKLWMQDNELDIGNEPDVEAGPVIWASPDIWIRNAADGGFVHQNPIAGETNYVYVTVRNRDTADGTAVLHLYWAKASTHMDWPKDWTNGNGPVCGTIGSGEVGSAIPVTVPAGGTITAGPFAWAPPSPSNFSTCFTEQEQHHFCLLARLVTQPDTLHPMTFPETESVGANTRNNNRVAWRNVSVVNNDEQPWRFGVLVRGSRTSAADARLVVTSPANDNGHTFFDVGAVTLELKGTLYDRWVKAGRKGTVDGSNDTTHTVRLASNGGWIGGLRLDSGEVAPVTIRFVYKTQPPSDTATFMVDLEQYGVSRDTAEPDGAVRFVVQRSGTLGVEPSAGERGGMWLGANTPNPARQETSIAFTLATACNVRLVLADIAGRELRTLAAGRYEPGEHSVTCNLSGIPSGTYLYELIANGTRMARTLVISR